MDILTARDFETAHVQHHAIIEDRGSIYSVSAGRVTDRATLRSFLSELKKDARYKNATHNAYAARIEKDSVMYETMSDDGEAGAGSIILKELQRENVKNICVCVTRWYGGLKLMNDRFAHIQNATRYMFKKSL